MINLPLDNITQADLETLVSSKATESRTLEFKSCLPSGSDEQVKEFLADVTSLANSSGGDVVFGIEEYQGIADKICGLPIANSDKETLRLENILRDCTQPRLVGIKLKWITGDRHQPCLIIRVSNSLASPHRVTFKNSNRFFSRNSAGKYEMDTHELRQAFLTSDQIPQKLRDMHAGAVERSKGINFPFETKHDPVAIVSLIPMSMFRERVDFVINDENAFCYVKPSGGINYLETLDGVVVYAPLNTDRRTRAYALTHRTGVIEATWAIGRKDDMNGKPVKFVWASSFLDGLVHAVLSGAIRQRSYGLDGPWAILTTVRNFEGFRLVLGDHNQSEPAWLDEAHLPELLLENPNEESLVPLAKAIYWLFGESAPHDKF